MQSIEIGIWCYLWILANMEKHVGELDMHQFQQRHTFIVCLTSFVFDRRREADR